MWGLTKIYLNFSLIQDMFECNKILNPNKIVAQKKFGSKKYSGFKNL